MLFCFCQYSEYMVTIRKDNFRNEEEYITLESIVPKNHLVRKIENAIDFNFIYDDREKHEMRYTKLRGLAKIEMELVFILF